MSAFASFFSQLSWEHKRLRVGDDVFCCLVPHRLPCSDPFECGVNAECDSMSSLDISFMGVGSCTGTANANCSALAESENCFNEVIKAVDQGTCMPDNITEAANCFGFAVAEVFAQAYVEINCTGQASGCGFAQANAKAWACTFAGVLVDLEVRAGGDQPLCDLSISPMAAAFASVATEVQVNICANGTEFKREFQQEFGQRIEQLVVDAMASCMVNCTVGKRRSALCLL